MATNLQTPILNSLRSVNFFNGRLLTGEDLTTEQQVNRAARNTLGRAVGSGVVHGLEVSKSVKFNSVQSPALTVTKGLALNLRGAQLTLSADTDIALVRPLGTTNGAATVFQDCKPVQSGVYVAGAGVYLLTIGPANAPQGLAEVSGVSSAAAPCNSNYNADGVQFRLIQVDQVMGLSQAQLTDANHLRNLVAYKCFGVDAWNGIWTDPLAVPVDQFGLADTLRSNQTLTGCEVPLAVLNWTADQGIVFADMWSVRRPVIARSSTDDWTPVGNSRRVADGLAMFLQFQAQVSDMVDFGAGGLPLTTISAGDFFSYLPAAGFIPIGNLNPAAGFDYLKFFLNRTYNGPVFMEGARLQRLLWTSFTYPPIDLSGQELIWVYQVRENQEAIDDDAGVGPALYMLFTNGHVPFQGEAQYDLNYWDYANYV
ncbi:MAG TPA: hypothetical protein VGL72_07640 [Bryobacteraceae bacterium]